MAFAIVPNFYDHPPVVVQELFFIILIFAILYLVRKPARSNYKYLRILFWLAVVYSFSNLFVEVSNTDRVIVLVLALITAIVKHRSLQRS
jgi:potassium efflux system protein